ncbi:MAG: hypothetical protein MUP04_00280 [Anaerolineae bacterium]|nr:hypothetical protein [Anaerolineae bacterium]
MEEFKAGDRVRVKPRNEWGTIELGPDADEGVIRQFYRYLGKTGEVIRIEAHRHVPDFNVVVRLKDADSELWFHQAMLKKVEVEKRPLGFKLS